MVKRERSVKKTAAKRASSRSVKKTAAKRSAAARRSNKRHTSNQIFKKVNLKKMKLMLSDRSLDSWARKYGFPVPSRLPEKKRIAARFLYGEVIVGMEDLQLYKTYSEFPQIKPMMADLMADSIYRLSQESKDFLLKQRVFQIATPVHIREFQQMPSGQILRKLPKSQSRGDPKKKPSKAELDADRDYFQDRKAEIIKKRTDKKIKLWTKSLLALIGLDFIVDFEEGLDFGKVIDLLEAGAYGAAILELIAILTLVIKNKGFWKWLVKKHGTLGALRILVGLGGKLLPALLLASILYSLGTIIAEAKKAMDASDEELIYIYKKTHSFPGKDKILNDNGMGHIIAMVK